MMQPETVARARAVLATSRGLGFPVPGFVHMCADPFDPAIFDDPDAPPPVSADRLKAELEQAIEDLLGGASVTPPAVARGACRVCGQCPGLPCKILGRHLRYLRLQGRTVYHRQRAVLRMAAALPVPVLDATPAHLMAWREGLRALAPETIVHYASHATQLYKWAIAEGLRGDNPAAGLPVPRTGRRVPRPISEAKLMRAIESAPRRIRCWLVLAAWAGLRAKEIALLDRSAVLDTAEPPVLVVACATTKGGVTERVVPLSAFVLAELRAYGLPVSGPVFLAVATRGPNTPANVSMLANEYLHELGIDDTLHSLRHRFGTKTYQARRDLRAVQALLGHASPTATAGYAAYDNAEAAADVEALPVPAPRLRAVAGDDLA
jgi:integrase/recombinase XerC